MIGSTFDSSCDFDVFLVIPLTKRRVHRTESSHTISLNEAPPSGADGTWKGFHLPFRQKSFQVSGQPTEVFGSDTNVISWWDMESLRKKLTSN